MSHTPREAPVSVSGNRQSALDRAYRKFIQGDRLDMQGLAADLGVDRTTLFRWVGSRDDLLTLVLSQLGARTIVNARAACTVTGATRVAEIMALFAEGLINAAFFRSYLEREGQRALRLLTTRRNGVQANMTNAVEDLLNAEYDMASLSQPIAAHDLAFLLIRVLESFVYTDMITGEPPRAENARMAFLILLR